MRVLGKCISTDVESQNLWCVAEKNDGEFTRESVKPPNRYKHGSPPMANSLRADSNTCCFEQ